MLPLIWILQNKEKRTPIWQRNVCLTLFILHENWGFSHSDAGDSEGKNTSPLSPSSCLPRFSTIELSVVSKKPIKQLLIGQSVLSLTNSRGSRVAGRGARVAGPMSRSRVQCRGRGSKVAVAGPMSRQGKMIWKRLIWKQYEGKKPFLCTILYGSQFTGYGC